jgi:hypothetical protein
MNMRTNNLNLDIDLEETFAERVNFDETRIDCAVESTEFGDQANVALRYGFVRIGAADTTRKGAHSSNTCAQCVDWQTLLATIGGAFLIRASRCYLLMPPYQLLPLVSLSPVRV